MSLFRNNRSVEAEVCLEMGNSNDSCKCAEGCEKGGQVPEDLEAKQQSFHSQKEDIVVLPPKPHFVDQDHKGFVVQVPKLHAFSFQGGGDSGTDSPDKSSKKGGKLAAPPLNYIHELKEIESSRNPRDSQPPGVAAKSPVKVNPDKASSVGSWAGSGPCLTITSKIVRRKMPNGAEYEGDTDEFGQAHGKGKYTSPTGDVYEGDFVGGKMNGTGTMIDAQGNSYSGGWRNGLRSGRGVERCSNGDTYEGEFVDDLKQGYGRHFSYNRSVLLSQWVRICWELPS